MKLKDIFRIQEVLDERKTAYDRRIFYRKL